MDNRPSPAGRSDVDGEYQDLPSPLPTRSRLSPVRARHPRAAAAAAAASASATASASGRGHTRSVSITTSTSINPFALHGYGGGQGYGSSGNRLGAPTTTPALSRSRSRPTSLSPSPSSPTQPTNSTPTSSPDINTSPFLQLTYPYPLAFLAALDMIYNLYHQSHINRHNTGHGHTTSTTTVTQTTTPYTLLGLALCRAVVLGVGMGCSKRWRRRGGWLGLICGASFGVVVWSGCAGVLQGQHRRFVGGTRTGTGTGTGIGTGPGVGTGIGQAGQRMVLTSGDKIDGWFLLITALLSTFEYLTYLLLLRLSPSTRSHQAQSHYTHTHARQTSHSRSHHHSRHSSRAYSRRPSYSHTNIKTRPFALRSPPNVQYSNNDSGPLEGSSRRDQARSLSPSPLLSPLRAFERDETSERSRRRPLGETSSDSTGVRDQRRGNRRASACSTVRPLGPGRSGNDTVSVLGPGEEDGASAADTNQGEGAASTWQVVPVWEGGEDPWSGSACQAEPRVDSDDKRYGNRDHGGHLDGYEIGDETRVGRVEEDEREDEHDGSDPASPGDQLHPDDDDDDDNDRHAYDYNHADSNDHDNDNEQEYEYEYDSDASSSSSSSSISASSIIDLPPPLQPSRIVPSVSFNRGLRLDAIAQVQAPPPQTAEELELDTSPIFGPSVHRARSRPRPKPGRGHGDGDGGVPDRDARSTSAERGEMLVAVADRERDQREGRHYGTFGMV